MTQFNLSPTEKAATRRSASNDRMARYLKADAERYAEVINPINKESDRLWCFLEGTAQLFEEAAAAWRAYYRTPTDAMQEAALQADVDALHQYDEVIRLMLVKTRKGERLW